MYSKVLHLKFLFLVHLQVVLTLDSPVGQCLGTRPSQVYCESLKTRCLSSREKRIMGGQIVTSASEFPHMVHVMTYMPGIEPATPESAYTCGGTLIHERFVLVGARCVHGSLLFDNYGFEMFYIKDDWSVMVTAGRYDLGNYKHAFRTYAAKYIVPMEYTFTGVMEYDIALIELKDSMPISKYIRPACLPSPYPGKQNAVLPPTALILGWGEGIFEKDYYLLRKATVNIMSPGDCCSAVPNYTETECISDIPFKIICTTPIRPEVCHGDSGGPLSIKQISYDECGRMCIRYTVLGVISRPWGYECNKTGRVEPFYSIDVSHYIEWIENYIWPFYQD